MGFSGKTYISNKFQRPRHIKTIAIIASISVKNFFEGLKEILNFSSSIKNILNFWCPRRESNPHDIAITGF